MSGHHVFVEHGAGEARKQIKRIDTKVVKRHNSVFGSLDLKRRYELEDALKTFRSVSAVAKPDGDVDRVDEAAETYMNTADSLIDKAGVPDPLITGNSTEAQVQQEPVDNPETRREQCDNGHPLNPEWAEQPCPKCAAEANRGQELGDLKKTHDLLAANELTGKYEVATLHELRDACIEALVFPVLDWEKRLKKYREFLKRLDSIVAHREWYQSQNHLEVWPERDGNRLWGDNELEDLAVPVDAVRATTKDKCVIPYQRVTLLYGTYGIGKSWIATDTILDPIETGGRVVYRLCDEGNATGIADLQDRLKTLKADPHSENIRVIADDMFDEDDLRSEIKLAIKWLLAADNPKHSIFVIDSLTFAGGAINDQNEFADWFKQEVQDLTLAGLTVLIIGHEGKNEPEKGPLGTTACPAKVHLVLRAHCKEGQTPWTPDHPGELTITVIKDRVAATRIGRYKDACIIRGSSDNELLSLSWDPPGTQTEQVLAAQRSKKRDIEQEIRACIREHDGSYEGKDQLRAEIKCRVNYFNTAIKNMQDRGELIVISRRPKPTRFELT